MLEPKHILLLVAIIITITVIALCIYLWRLTSSSHKQDPSDKAVQSVFQDVLHDLRTLIDETKAIQADLKEIAKQHRTITDRTETLIGYTRELACNNKTSIESRKLTLSMYLFLNTHPYHPIRVIWVCFFLLLSFFPNILLLFYFYYNGQTYTKSHSKTRALTGFQTELKTKKS